MTDPVFDVSGAVAALNQTFDYAYPSMVVVGELSSFKVAKSKWLYFDIKDDQSKLKCFGTVFQLTTALEDGMIVEISAQPKLHNLYGFSLNVQSIKPVGEGSLKKAATLLQQKLEKEGLFDLARKRKLPYPPSHIALIASGESAGYADFMKIIKARWPYITIDHYEVYVQGAQSEESVTSAIRKVNELSYQPEAIVVIRGGGSADDLSAFSSEIVTRAVAASRIPTVVAIGHEIDSSLAELAADLHASTPSNAAELLVPDRLDVEQSLSSSKKFLDRVIEDELMSRRSELTDMSEDLQSYIEQFITRERTYADKLHIRLSSYHPQQVLKHGYALVRSAGKLVRGRGSLESGDIIEVELESSKITAQVSNVEES